MTTPKFGIAEKGANRAMAVIVSLAASFVVSGCGETELNGKIFDLMGVSSSAQAAAKQEPKMAVRSGLVLPPDQNRLPEPGSAGQDSGAALAAVDDPDQRRKLAAAERERQHKAYCSGQLSWKDRVVDKDAAPKSPYGPCGLLGDVVK